MRAVARRRMSVQLAANITGRDQHGKIASRGPLHFVQACAQFWFDEAQSERLVNGRLGRKRLLRFQRRKTARGGRQLSQMSFAARQPDQTEAPILVSGSLDI